MKTASTFRRTPAPARWVLPLLALTGGGAAAQSTPSPPLPTVVERPATPAPDARGDGRGTSGGDRSYAVPIAEIIGFDFLLNRYNRRFSGSTDYDVSAGSIRRNLRGAWVIDNDPFKINQFAHPYQGSLYHGAARSTGLGYWESSALTFLGSAWWEITGEQTPPSRNDQIASGIAGSFLGEPLFRIAKLILRGESRVPYEWRQWGAALVSPPLGVNRLLYGARFDDSFDDHEPVYYGRLRIGANRVTHDDAPVGSRLQRTTGELDYGLDYGLPGQRGYTYTRPFDYFAFRAVVSNPDGLENLSSRGLLVGSDYAIGRDVRGLWGLYGGYDYLAPQLFHLSATSLSLGTTAQWWVSPTYALQGTALAGFSYAAASTSRPSANDRDYHYGVAPSMGLAMRLIAGDKVSADLSAQKFVLGRLANRSAGRDDVSRVDAALTWRISGPHAVGLKYVWSHRRAAFPTQPDRGQTLATIGLYYTLIGLDGFGTVEWR